MGILQLWSPWTFVKITEPNEKGEEKIVGTKTVFHKSFYKWNGKKYDVRENKWIRIIGRVD